jgi:hypothetical protein
MSTHALYRFFDNAGELLYVGITMNPAARWKQHSKDKDWWTEVANITVEPHPGREAVLEAERLAILTEKPLYNTVHNRPTMKVVPPQPAERRIVWFCQECRQPIRDDEGYVEVLFRDIQEYEARYAEWKAKKPNLIAVPATYYFDCPQQARWRIHHRACDPESEQDGYWFGVERIRTHAEVLSWTAHLMEKNWLKHTDWIALIRSTLNNRDVAA